MEDVHDAWAHRAAAGDRVLLSAQCDARHGTWLLGRRLLSLAVLLGLMALVYGIMVRPAASAATACGTR